MNEFYNYLRKLTWHKLTNIRNKRFPDVSEYGGNFNFPDMTKVGLFKRQIKAVTAKDGIGGVIDGTFEISILPFAWDAVKAFVVSVFNRSYLTDYFLPFILAIIALVFSWNFNG